MQNKFKLNDIVRLKMIVPKFPKHQYSNIMSKSLVVENIDGRIVTIDSLTYKGQILYGIEFNCFEYSQMRLIISENELQGMII